jgi:hypothetical protein
LTLGGEKQDPRPFFSRASALPVPLVNFITPNRQEAKPMNGKQQPHTFISRNSSRAATAVLAIAVVCSVTMIVTHPAEAQTYNVTYNFTGGADGSLSARNDDR